MMYSSISSTLTVALLLSSSTFANSERLANRRFNPKDVGSSHSKIFVTFEELYKSKASKQDAKTLKSDFMYAMTRTCEDEEHTVCIDKVLKAQELVEDYIKKHDLTRFKEGEKLTPTYPYGMGSKLKDDLDKVFDMTYDLTKDNLEETINRMSTIEAEIESLSFVLPSYRNMALSAVSVAKESTRMWHKVIHDEEHTFKHIKVAKGSGDQRRRLDDGGGFLSLCTLGRLPLLINADIIGVLITPIAAFTSTPTGMASSYAALPVYLFNWYFDEPTGAPEDMSLFGAFANYAWLPFLVQSTTAALPTSYLSFLAFLMTGDCEEEETPAPSVAPSTSPSEAPIAAPSTSPSEAPTAAPSTPPSEAPTAAPSTPPSVSIAPSSNPSISAAPSLSSHPSLVPSVP